MSPQPETPLGPPPETFTVLNPATGQELTRLPVAGTDEIDRVVFAAQKAVSTWRRTPAAERAEMLKQGARRLRHHAEELAQLQTAENGKPIQDSRGGVEAGIGTIEQYAELGPLHRGRSLQGAPQATDLMVSEPYGVAACLIPWNDPFAIAAGLISANLVVGNTVIVKPSEQAPLVVRRLVELLDLPEGVLAPLSGQGATGAALVAHPGTDLVTHVGSSRTGREIAAVCASTMKTAVLELGGKDALIIDRDLDPVWAAEQAASGAFANAGQICTAVERILVHEALAEPFLEALVERARGLRMGPGTDPDTQLGPLIGPELREKVHEQVCAAVAQGARRLCGGEIPAGSGFFYPATVLSDCHESMAIMAEETFGPVAPVRIVSSFEEALDRANDTTYGLSATVLSANQAHIQQAVVELDVATVKVNAVWGGAPGGAASPRRGSGQGFGYGPELLDEVTQTKVIHIEAPPS